MIKPRHHEGVTAFFFFVGIALVVGLLSLRYGVDSRIDEHRTTN
jgi:hypothetical protein